MIFKAGMGWQNSEMTDLQKSFFAPGEVEDFGGKVFTTVTLIDEGYLTKSETERQVFLNISDARAALADALERGDAIVKSQDLILFDRGRIRRAVAERIYPQAGLSEDQIRGRNRDGAPVGLDGTPFRKSVSKGAAADRAMAHAASHMGPRERTGGDAIREMLARHRGATVSNASPHHYEASAHGDGSCRHCGHRETQQGASHLAKSGDPLRDAYTAFGADSGDMKAAAAELDALVERLRNDG